MEGEFVGEELVVEILVSIKRGEKKGQSKNALDERTTAILNEWLKNHLTNPYPSTDDKLQLMNATGFTLIQLNNWFSNARRRKLKNKGFSKSRGKKSTTQSTNFVRPTLNYYIKFFIIFFCFLGRFAAQL
jgi:hypothetical protein